MKLRFFIPTENITIEVDSAVLAPENMRPCCEAAHDLVTHLRTIDPEEKNIIAHGHMAVSTGAILSNPRTNAEIVESRFLRVLVAYDIPNVPYTVVAKDAAQDHARPDADRREE